jgi:hypothetical protein
VSVQSAVGVVEETHLNGDVGVPLAAQYTEIIYVVPDELEFFSMHFFRDGNGKTRGRVSADGNGGSSRYMLHAAKSARVLA